MSDNGSGAVALDVISSLHEVDAAEWDACAGRENPFVQHRFLLALEDSGSAVRETGWLGQHLLLRDDDGTLKACAPVYLKNHSQGEYIFDFAWADALHRAGGQYYPKLQSAVPFSPVTGPRLLTPHADLKPVLARGLAQLAEQSGASSVHATFCRADELAAFEAAGFCRRLSHQYHWQNYGYRSFEGFLDELSARKRKAIRKERAAVGASGVKLKQLHGDDIRPEHWDAFWLFYQDTGARKWGTPYLTREFFEELHDSMRDEVLLVLGEADGQPVCGALNLIGENTLFGRYWGCSEAFKHLHFEACYYSAIDFAITHDLRCVEAGAQGHHKMQRGYLPALTWSAHYLCNQSFSDAVGNFVREEERVLRQELAEIDAADNPFRRDQDGQPLRSAALILPEHLSAQT